MKNVTYRLLDASLYDYPLIQNWLTDKAAKGWHLEKVGSMFWKFRRGEPKAVRYEITYAPKASAFHSRPTEAEEDLAELCAQAGWVRAASAAQIQVFRNDDPNATPLETDEGQRLANIRRTMKRHYFPPYLLMIFLFALQFAMHTSTLLRNPVLTLSSPLMFSTLVMLLFVIVVYAVMLFDGFLWLRRAQRAVDEGRDIPHSTFYRWFRLVVWAVLVVYLCALFWMGGMTTTAAILGISAITVACTVGSIKLFKELNAPKWVNMVVPAAATALVMGFLLTLFAISMDQIVLNEELPHPDSIPLMLSDLTGSAEAEHTVLEESSTPLVSYGRYSDEEGDERISYAIIDVHCGAFYDLCLNEQEQDFLQSAYYLSNGIIALNQGDLWGAEYARRAPGDSNDRWLICWEDRIVSLRASWPMTDEQIKAAAEILKP